MMLRLRTRPSLRRTAAIVVALGVGAADASLLFIGARPRSRGEAADRAEVAAEPPIAIAWRAAAEPDSEALPTDAPSSLAADPDAGSSVFHRCLWVTGPPCVLHGEGQSSCIMTAICPAGMRVVSGACEGFTSVAIGRSAPSFELTSWSCIATRIIPIHKDNELSARAFCCP